MAQNRAPGTRLSFQFITLWFALLVSAHHAAFHQLSPNKVRPNDRDNVATGAKSPVRKPQTALHISWGFGSKKEEPKKPDKLSADAASKGTLGGVAGIMDSSTYHFYLSIGLAYRPSLTTNYSR